MRQVLHRRLATGMRAGWTLPGAEICILHGAAVRSRAPKSWAKIKRFLNVSRRMKSAGR